MCRFVATREAAIGEVHDRAHDVLVGAWFDGVGDLASRSSEAAARTLPDGHLEAAARHRSFPPLPASVREFRSPEEEERRPVMAPERISAFAALPGVEPTPANGERMRLLRHLTAELSRLTPLAGGPRRAVLHDETVALLDLLLARMGDARRVPGDRPRARPPKSEAAPTSVAANPRVGSGGGSHAGLSPRRPPAGDRADGGPAGR